MFHQLPRLRLVHVCCTPGLVLLALSGCGPSPASTAPDVAAPAAPSWDEQVASVRAGRSRQIIVSGDPVSAEQWLALSDGCAALEVLEVDAAEVSDDNLSAFAALPRLKRLKLGAPVGNAGLVHLTGAMELTRLNLPQAQFTDDGLATIAALPKLELLRFDSPNVTDAGLAHIAGMQSLRFLHLIDVPITDAGLVHLRGMTRLESFYLDGGNCSDEALGELLQALPKLHFHKDQLHLPDDPHAHAHD